MLYYRDNHYRLNSGTYMALDAIPDRITCDQYVEDREDDKLLFMSAIGYDTIVRRLIREMKAAGNHKIHFGNTYSNVTLGTQVFKNYDISEKYIKEATSIHFVLKRKDYIDTKEGNHVFYFYSKGEMDEDKFKKQLFHKIDKNTAIPIMEEWMDWLYSFLIENRMLFVQNTNAPYDIEDSIFVIKAKVNERIISHEISVALKNNLISMNGTNAHSSALEDVVGLDSYLNKFNKELTDKIQENFRAKFTPGEDEYDKYVNYIDDFVSKKDGVEMYEAQKAVIQAAVNNMKTNRTTNIIGECGSGKTLIASSAVYAHNANKYKGFNAIVMCPSHLVQKWKREVENRIPNARGYIINNTTDLRTIEDKLLDKNKLENSYVIVSKETAKLSYELRPAAVWSVSKNTFRCPDCGGLLYTIKKEGKGRYAQEKKVYFDERTFMKQNATNKVCRHCGAKLWTVSNKEENTEWFKLGSPGYVLRRHIPKLAEELLNSDNKMVNKKNAGFNKEILKQYSLYKKGENYDECKRSPRKISISFYIKKFLKGVFDYCILDEAHELKGTSEQGYAAYDLIQSSKKTLLLTGTLLNGYADSLFYLLYRTNSRLMKKEGFDYKDEAEFARLYGVYSNESTLRLSSTTNRYETHGTKKEKRLPGVSPLVFTKFLLNNSVFLSLADMEDGLPDYKEYPIGITIEDREVREAYLKIEEAFVDATKNKRDGKGKMILPLLQAMTIYPDAPYCAEPIYNPDNNQIECEPKLLEEKISDKDKELLRIVNEKIKNGEKVLVYYNSVNKTTLGKHLIKMFKDNGIYADELRASEKADSREEWIEEKLHKGLQVLICNPRLVETGLDLIDFTTIVFYQVGYNLFTMRQASRRSWRLSQTKPISVYFMYYRDTVQEQALALMATKLHASMAIEGKFSEEGLRALSNNEDVLTQVARNVTEGIKENVNIDMFASNERVKEISNKRRIHNSNCESLEFNLDKYGHRKLFGQITKMKVNNYVDLDLGLNLKRPKRIELTV